jgi:hypothetical protein
MEALNKSVRGECFPFAPSIHRASAALGTNGKFIEPLHSDLISVSLGQIYPTTLMGSTTLCRNGGDFSHEQASRPIPYYWIPAFAGMTALG